MDNRTMVGAGAPPPPSEVEVRTMQSDLASMAQSGGGMPRFQNVAVDGLTADKEYNAPSRVMESMAAVSPASAQVPVQPTSPALPPSIPVSSSVETEQPKKDMYPIFIVAVVGILALGAVGYFAYITFFTGSASQSPSVATNQTPTLPAVATTTAPTTTASSSTAVTASTTTATAPSNELSSAHVSLFKKPADQIITIGFGTTSASTYRKTMAGSLAAIKAGSTLIEIDPKANDGNNLSMQGLLSIAGGTVLNAQALASFNPDPTFFIYRDKSGLWPGYVLALNTGQTSNSAIANVKQLESSAGISNLFLVDPGTASSDGFTDSVTAGVPVRILPFSGLSIPSYFTYGWYGNYLILSTSKNGFGAAAVNL